MPAMSATALPRLMPDRRAQAAALDLAASSLSPEWVAPVTVAGDAGAVRVGAGAALVAAVMAVAGILIALLAG